MAPRLLPPIVGASLIIVGACTGAQPAQPVTDPVTEPALTTDAPAADASTTADEGRHDATAPPARNCGRGLSPAQLSPEEWAKRRGTEARRFDELMTSKAEPAEACGVEGQIELLMRLTCADGANPFGSFGEAHGSRAGNVGPGGACGHIIDLYRVPCPEQTYEVFIDLYVCPAR